MARQVLYLHWRASRLVLLPFVLAAFGLPLLAVQGMGAASVDAGMRHALTIAEGMDLWLPLFPALAGALGATLALTAWNWDHQGGHVYALSLPVSRGRYALLKLGAGAALLLLPTAAFLAGAVLATASVEVPDGLRTYPVAVSVRFLSAALVIYAVLFAMAAGTIRTTVWVLTTMVVALVTGSLLTEMLVEAGLVREGFNLMATVGDLLMEWPGPLHVLAGNWRLIDV